MSDDVVPHNRIPLYICNVHKTKDISRFEKKKMEQMDVFPTLLDVFSVCSKYRGVGRSLFDVSGANDKEKAENISRLILEGGFLLKMISRFRCPM